MNYFLTAYALALVSTTVAAAAADMPTHKSAPALAPVEAFSWAGCYVGASAGAMGSYAAFSGSNTSVDAQARIAEQAGCNFQIGKWVVGGEGEISEGFWEGQKSRSNQDLALRAGYAFDRTLAFGKVGAAFAQSTFGWRFPALNLVERTPQDRTGLLLGAGVEYAIDRHWSVKGEFDYIDYGSRDVAFTGPRPRNIDVGTSQTVGDIGVNYRF